MAIRYDANAPSGWGVDETNHFAKIPTGYVLQNGQYVAPGTSSSSSNSNQSGSGFDTSAPAANSAPYQTPAQVAAAAASGIDLTPFGAKGGDVSYLRSTLESQYDDITPIVANVNGSLVTVGFKGTKIPTAVVVGPNGERVTVRTDNKTGKYRTLNEMTSQGFNVEKAPGIANNNTNYNTGSGTDLANKPSLTLSNGTVISPSDPNYDTYKNLQGVTVNGNNNLQPVHVGPTQFAQLVSQGLTESDIVRQGTDILIKPTSRFFNQVAPSAGSGSTTVGGTTTGTTTTPTSGSGTTGAPSPTTVDPSDKAWINSYYQKFFDRDATSSELQNWSKETPEALNQFLSGETKKTGYTSKYFQDVNNKSLQEALGVIDGSNLPPAIKDLWKTVVKGYPQGIEFNSDEILNTFQKIKEQTIDPHFRELTDIAMNDFKTQSANLQTNRAQELEAQDANAKASMEQAKKGLEGSGLTFSGKAIDQLGKDSAFQQPGGNPGSQLPPQLPFGGALAEGKVNQANRLMATSSESRYNQAMQGLGVAAETKLGTQQAQGLGVNYNAIGGITGDLNTQKEGQYGTTLNQIIDNYTKKQTLNTNSTAT